MARLCPHFVIVLNSVKKVQHLHSLIKIRQLLKVLMLKNLPFQVSCDFNDFLAVYRRLTVYFFKSHYICDDAMLLTLRTPLEIRILSCSKYMSHVYSSFI